MRPLVIVCALFALLMATWSVYSISLLPPKLTPRALKMATATTHVVVDTPTSSVLDLRQNSYDFDAMTQRAIVLGNVIANGAVRESIASKAGIQSQQLQVTAPFTRRQPRSVGTTNQKKTSDIFASTDQYRLNIQANPSVPMLDIYAQAPDAKSAQTVANAAVDGLRAYLENLASTQQIPEKDQLRLLQLGRADAVVINGGVEWQVALLVFILSFSLACATGIFVSRVARGVRVAALADRQAAT
jgi:hypothetical protein